MLGGRERGLITYTAPMLALDHRPQPEAVHKVREAGMLEARNASKTFGGIQALLGVSLTVTEGTIAGLIGPNGSGKTTLLNCLSGVVKLTTGSIALDGGDATGWPPERFARAGIVRTFQNIRLFSQLTALQNVEVCALAASGLSRAAARELAMLLLADLGLDGLAERHAVTLSYGDQRRVEIARALAARPRFLLLDEPAAGMNEAESDALAETLARIRDRLECGVLIVEHNLRVVMGLCERVYVLNEGRLISDGSADDVRRDAAVIAAYIGSPRQPRAARLDSDPRERESPASMQGKSPESKKE